MPGTLVQQCLICGQSIDGDEAYYQHHLNSCLDSQSNVQQKQAAIPPLPTPSFPVASPSASPSLLSEAADASWVLDADARLQAQALAEVANDNATLSSAYNPTPASWVGSDDGKHAVEGTAGLVPILGKLLEESCQAGRTVEAFLCGPCALHVSFELRDAGWSCGYRNAQMIFSALRALDCYATKLQRNIRGEIPIPTILEMQTIIEQAWKCGHDPDGAKHFKHKLKKSRRWVGTTEIYTALVYLGIRARVVDFPKRKLNPSAGVHHALVNWIKDYFATSPDTASASSSGKKRESLSPAGPDATDDDDDSLVHRTQRQPLYLQHQGHSRTVVGIERAADGEDYLILFDPGKRIEKGLARIANASVAQRAEGVAQKKIKLDDDAHAFPSAPNGAALVQSKLDAARRGFGLGAMGSTELDVSKWRKHLEPFRVSLSSLSKKDEYQILYVEEGPLLTMAERADKRIVRSKVVN